MIVSFSRGFAFVAIPRTGSHTVRDTLRPYLAPTDWEQCTRFEKRFCPVKHIAAIGHGHLSARLIRAALIPGLWERLTTFAFVRDPLARFQSAYLLLNRGRGLDAELALDGMKRVLSEPTEHQAIHYRPQADFVCDDEGAQMVTRIGRCETLSTDLTTICEMLAVPAMTAPRTNAAPYPHGFAPDAELRELVSRRYARDYALIAGLSEAAE